MDGRGDKRKTKNDSQALGLCKTMDGDAIKRDSGDHREPSVCGSRLQALLPPLYAAFPGPMLCDPFCFMFHQHGNRIPVNYKKK